MDPTRALPKSDLPRNRLLAALPREAYLRLLPNLEHVLLHRNEILYEYDAPVRHAWFPEQGLVALLITLEDGHSVQVAAVGNLGVLGVSLVLGAKTSLRRALVEIPGSAMRMKADAFVAAFERGGIFQKTLLKYIRCRMFMISQYAACNRAHLLPKRLARLLLTVHDRIGSAEFPMTHEFISRMLGTARSEVAKTAALFRRAGMIEYHRNKIRILDRKKLESAVCECYWAVEEEFDRVFPKQR